ncbi:MAG: large conductance mechanosensitive channel protein MscL [Clostridiaceae bacterium]
MKSFIKEFKAFALTGNVFDMAIGIILGGAISALVKSLVDNVISPIIGMTFGTPDFSRITLGPIMIGSFINAIIAFLILAFILFLMIKGINKMKRKPVVEEAAPSLSNEEILLAEIRDLLKNGKSTF